MQQPSFTKTRVLITGISTFFIFSMLLWEHLHGGVPSHHILHQKELPAISNWWGGLLLPFLTWILVGRVDKRINKENIPVQQKEGQNIKIFGLFLLGLLLGTLLAISFIHEYRPFLDNVLYILLLLSLLVPIFYAEFILGFVIGMTYTFGVILPTVFILIVAAVGFLAFKFVRLVVFKVAKVFGK